MQVKIILNSRKQETIEISHDGFHASVPYGRSTGKYEMKKVDARIAANGAKILWDIVKDLPINKAENILREKVSEFGANTTLAISYLLYKLSKKKVDGNIFPFPLGNVAGGWDKRQIQEYLVIPVSAKTMRDAIQINRTVWDEVGRKIGVRKNDENGWVSKEDDIKTLDVVADVAESHGARVGLDIAASHLWNGTHYVFDSLGKKYTPDEQYNFVYDLIDFYELLYVEDPFHEDDMESFYDLTSEVHDRCVITGDDLYATTPERVSTGIDMEATNGVLIKPDQVGTLSGAEKVIELSHKAGLIPTVSHRSGDTEESILADLAVQWKCPFVKFGVTGTEREAKLNRLVELWNSVDNPRMNKIKLK